MTPCDLSCQRRRPRAPPPGAVTRAWHACRCHAACHAVTLSVPQPAQGSSVFSSALPATPRRPVSLPLFVHYVVLFIEFCLCWSFIAFTFYLWRSGRTENMRSLMHRLRRIPTLRSSREIRELLVNQLYQIVGNICVENALVKSFPDGSKI